MNRTSYIILKLLFQSNLSSEEILKYININNLTLNTNIKNINEKLKSLNLPKISLENGEYSLFLSKREKEKFYNSCTDYSQNQRWNYLILKLLLEKELNLDKEKDLLNVSRATIQRDLKKIKNILEEYNIQVNSILWKGIYLLQKDNKNIYKLVFEIFVKFYYEIDNLPKVLKNYLKKLFIIDYKVLEKKIYIIFTKFNLHLNELALKTFLALDLCFFIFPDFYLESVLEELETIKNNKNFLKIKEELLKEDIFFPNYLNYIALGIYNLIYKQYTNKEKYKSIFQYLEKVFTFKLSETAKYNIYLCLHYGVFKYKNNIYTVTEYTSSKINSKLLKLIYSFLNHFRIDLLYGDVLSLLNLIKKSLKEEEKKNLKKILILKNNFNQHNMENIRNYLKYLYPNFFIEIESFTCGRIKLNLKNDYDLILSNSKLEHKFIFIYYKDIPEIPEIIDNYLIERHIISISHN